MFLTYTYLDDRSCYSYTCVLPLLMNCNVSFCVVILTNLLACMPRQNSRLCGSGWLRLAGMGEEHQTTICFQPTEYLPKVINKIMVSQLLQNRITSSSSSKQPEDANKVLKEFLSLDLKARYTFDSERDSSESELCRQQGKNSEECITLKMNSKRLFEAMQQHGFFCALPSNPEKTHMECKPLPTP
ncbi:hypothetical protein D9756_001708 [Leucocoprinus leucothites]|uniref:Uncharacterized protein n=1 Tax=Leucocoprinus leucothites TaxID=201217 RepID=A0A8H5G4E2_9AGAR|nr:hypothetical protein D9756_001708 [Leucoagaricus leucothites]